MRSYESLGIELMQGKRSAKGQFASLSVKRFVVKLLLDECFQRLEAPKKVVPVNLLILRHGKEKVI